MPSPATDRVCEGCKEIWPLRPGQRWHTKECHGKYAMEKPKKKFVCANPECKREYEKTAHQIGAGSGEFHSVACANKARATDERVRFDRDSHGMGTQPKHGVGPCVEWTGTPTKDGYGAFTLANGKQVQAHIYAWGLINGPVPSKKCVLHACDNPKCVRNEPPGTHVVDGEEIPTAGHLFLHTKTVNNKDRTDKHRHPTSHLLQAEVDEIRDLYATGGHRQRALATRFRVSQPTISLIVNDLRWMYPKV